MKQFLCCFLLFVSLWELGASRNIPEGLAPAEFARQLLHDTEWVGVASISILETSLGYPFANLKSVADVNGVPYMIMTNLEYTAKDLTKDNRVGLMASQAQTGQCKENNKIAQDPTCGRVLITGKLIKITDQDAEYAAAKTALVAKHPVIGDWLKLAINPHHYFYIAKVDIEQVIVMAQLEGSKKVTVGDYFKVKLQN